MFPLKTNVMDWEVTLLQRKFIPTVKVCKAQGTKESQWMLSPTVVMHKVQRPKSLQLELFTCHFMPLEKRQCPLVSNPMGHCS